MEPLERGALYLFEEQYLTRLTQNVSAALMAKPTFIVTGSFDVRHPCNGDYRGKTFTPVIPIAGVLFLRRRLDSSR
jgi:hypothetical protein